FYVFARKGAKILSQRRKDAKMQSYNEYLCVTLRYFVKLCGIIFTRSCKTFLSRRRRGAKTLHQLIHFVIHQMAFPTAVEQIIGEFFFLFEWVGLFDASGFFFC